MISGIYNRGKHREKILDGLTKWPHLGQVIDALKVTKDRDVWKAMIVHATKYGT